MNQQDNEKTMALNNNDPVTMQPTGMPNSYTQQPTGISGTYTQQPMPNQQFQTGQQVSQNYANASQPQQFYRPDDQGMKMNQSGLMGQQLYNAGQQNPNPYAINNAAPAKVKKPVSKAKIIIPAVAGTAAVAAAIAVPLILKGHKGSAKQNYANEKTVTASANNTFSYASASSPSGKYLGSTGIEDMVAGGSYKSSMTLNLKDIYGYDIPSEAAYLKGIGISFDTEVSGKNLASTGSVSYGGISYIDLGFYAYDSTLAITSPTLFDGYMAVDTQTMLSDIQNSWLINQMNIDIDPSMFNQFSQMGTNSVGYLEEALKDLTDSIEYTETSPMDISIGNEMISCKGYDVTITAASMNSFLNNIIAFANDNMQANINPGFLSETDLHDVILHYYVNDANQLVKLLYADSFTADGDTVNVNVDFSFTGSEYLLDNTNGIITISSSYGDIAEIKINGSDSIQGTQSTSNWDVWFTADRTSVNVNYTSSLDTATGNTSARAYATAYNSYYGDSNTLFTVSMDGQYTDVNPGKSYTLNFSDLTLSSSDFTVSLSGSYSIAPLSGSVSKPSGNRYEILKMSESDFQGLATQVYSKIMSSNLMGLISQFMF